VEKKNGSALFIGCEEKRDAAQMKVDIIEQEVDFEKLTEYFLSVVPDSVYLVSFRDLPGEAAELSFYKDRDNLHRISATSDASGSKKFFAMIRELGWNSGVIDSLSYYLSQTGCEGIRNTEWFGKPVCIFHEPTGFVNSDYQVYPENVLDTLKIMHGEPVGRSAFLKRVYILTSAAFVER
jgi:hypothetical protein